MNEREERGLSKRAEDFLLTSQLCYLTSCVDLGKSVIPPESQFPWG